MVSLLCPAAAAVLGRTARPMSEAPVTAGRPLPWRRRLIQRSRIARILWERGMEGLTVWGRVWVLLMIVGASLGAPSLAVPIYKVWAATTAVFFLAWPLGFLYRPRKLRAVRHLPGQMAAGETVTYRVRITNEDIRAVHQLEVRERELPWGIDSEDAVVVTALQPGESRDVMLSLRAYNRGIYLLPPLLIGSIYPAALIRWHFPLSGSARLVVTPAYRHLSELDLRLGRQYQPGGLALSSSVGDSVEFFGTREYHQGDNPRHIHWPSWARTGEPVVKEFREEYFVRLALLLDGAAPDAAAVAAFEQAISLTASIADYLSRQDYLIDIFATGRRIYRFRAGRSLAHFDNILEILACLEPAPAVDITELAAEVLPEARRLTAVVMLWTAWDEPRIAFARQLRAVGVGIKGLIVGDRVPATAIPPDLADAITVLLGGRTVGERL